MENAWPNVKVSANMEVLFPFLLTFPTTVFLLGSVPVLYRIFSWEDTKTRKITQDGLRARWLSEVHESTVPPKLILLSEVVGEAEATICINPFQASPQSHHILRIRNKLPWSKCVSPGFCPAIQKSWWALRKEKNNKGKRGLFHLLPLLSIKPEQ